MGILLPEEDAIIILELEIAPMGVAEHLKINTLREYIPKMRVTHDLSFPGIKSKELLNSRVDKNKLKLIMFCHCLSRLIHQIVALRTKYPTQKMWLRKEDLKSAYRWLHLHSRSAIQSDVRVKINEIWYIIISLRITVGGAPGPADFYTFSDIGCDTINDLLDCDS